MLSTTWSHTRSSLVNSRPTASMWNLAFLLSSLITQSTDASAADPRIDALRAKIYCVEEKRFSVDYHDPEKRSIGNALLVELNDGTVLDEVEVEYPVGHKRRRAEGTPLLMNKFKRHFTSPLSSHISNPPYRHISHHFDEAHQKKSVQTPFSVILPDFGFLGSWIPFPMPLRSPSCPLTSSRISLLSLEAKNSISIEQKYKSIQFFQQCGA